MMELPAAVTAAPVAPAAMVWVVMALVGVGVLWLGA
jgi:hypothetical protein